jgi:hypothetical protein
MMDSSATKDGNAQKRQHGRLRVNVEGQYRFAGAPEWLNCLVIDLSTSGVALGGKTSFYAGDKIEMRFALEKRNVVIGVEITNLTGKSAGGKITSINDSDRLYIQDILNKNLLSGKNRL